MWLVASRYLYLPTSYQLSPKSYNMRRAYILFVVLFIVFSFAVSAVHAETPRIVISELLWMGSDFSASDEYVELYNPGDQAVDLSGWVLTKFTSGSAQVMYAFPAGTALAGKSYLLVAHYPSADSRAAHGVADAFIAPSLSLSNATLQIGLYTASPSAGGELVDIAGDAASPVGGAYVSGQTWQAMERRPGFGYGTAAEYWQTSSEKVNFKATSQVFGTPGAANSNAAPLAAFDAPLTAAVVETVSFDASATVDPEGQPLSFAWDFGDGGSSAGAVVEHVFVAAGTYTVSLNASDGARSATVSKTISIVAAPAPAFVLSCSAGIFISELLPDPEGADQDGEFIELVNATDHGVNLRQWVLADASGRRFIISPEQDFFVAAGGFAVFSQHDSGISLNNSSAERVELQCPVGQVVAAVDFLASGKTGQSFARDVSGSFSWTIKPTPDSENVLERKNTAPSAKIDAPVSAVAGRAVSIDGSDSEDPEGDILVYSWDFGDGHTAIGATAEHVYAQPRSYSVKLTVQDSGGLSSLATSTIKIAAVAVQVTAAVEPTAPAVSPAADAPQQSPATQRAITDAVRISEFLPSPADGANHEWIELYNPSEHEFSLTGWQIDDAEGGSKPYVLPADARIAARGYLVIQRVKSKLALNDGGDTVRFLDRSGELVQAVVYDATKKGLAVAWIDGRWQWTAAPTSGKTNVLRVPTAAKKVVKAEAVARADDSGDGRAVEVVPELPALRKAAAAKAGEMEISGTVTAPPGLWSARYFFIQTKDGGAQVYLSKGDLPQLAVGDAVRITGVWSSGTQEPRMRLANAAAVEKIGIAAAEPSDVPLDEVDKRPAELVRIAGVATGQKGEYVTVEDDTGTIRVRLPAESTADIVPGDSIEAVGVVRKSSSGYYLAVRSAEDFKLSSAAAAATADDTLGQSAQGAIAQVLPRSKAGVALALGGFVLGLVGLTVVAIRAWRLRNAGVNAPVDAAAR